MLRKQRWKKVGPLFFCKSKNPRNGLHLVATVDDYGMTRIIGTVQRIPGSRDPLLAELIEKTGGKP